MIANLAFDSTLNKFNLYGFSFMNEVNMSSTDGTSHELLLASEDGTQYRKPLNAATGSNVSLGGFDYTNAWFSNTELDLSDLPIGIYRIYVITSTNAYNDLVKMYDYGSVGDREFIFETKKYSFKTIPSLRKIYYLDISTITP